MIATTRTHGPIRIARLVAFTIALGVVVFATARATPPIAIPKGKHILVDGMLGPGEWADARRIPASDSVTIYLKRDASYLYVAVEPAGGAFSVDLYFDPGNGASILDLHASAKLGERKGSFGQWPEWDWWNNRGWAANVVRVANFEPRTFLVDNAKEYQIEIQRLGARRFWLSADVQTGEKTRTIPSDGTERHGRRWLELRL
ncbi:MAG TPA: hypothetical protein VLN44_02325 [Pyrinomonadaceae bacterium]|nr:hypothetical protein [Pyrinomonadaceae bacterium]